MNAEQRLTKIQAEQMHHALGNIHIHKNWKDKTVLAKAYRNKFFTYASDSNWNDLVKKGFADVNIQKNFDGSDMFFYYVTEKGVHELRERKTKETVA